jgi:hypothetical protein
MPGHLYHLPMASPSTVNAAVQTLLQLATPSTRRAWWKAFSVSGKDTDGAKVPIRVDIIRQTSAGSGGTAVTPRPLNPNHPAALCGAIERPTSEPTDGGVIVGGPWYITTVGGLFHLQIPLGDEIEMAVSQFLGLRITSEGTLSGVLASLDYLE